MAARLLQFFKQMASDDEGTRDRAVDNIASKLRHGLARVEDIASDESSATIACRSLLSYFDFEQRALASAPTPLVPAQAPRSGTRQTKDRRETTVKAAELVHALTANEACAREMVREGGVACLEGYRAVGPAATQPYVVAALENLTRVRSSWQSGAPGGQLQTKNHPLPRGNGLHNATHLRVGVTKWRARWVARGSTRSDAQVNDLRARVSHGDPKINLLAAELLEDLVSAGLVTGDALVTEGSVLADVCNFLPVLSRRTDPSAHPTPATCRPNSSAGLSGAQLSTQALSHHFRMLSRVIPSLRFSAETEPNSYKRAAYLTILLCSALAGSLKYLSGPLLSKAGIMLIRLAPNLILAAQDGETREALADHLPAILTHVAEVLLQETERDGVGSSCSPVSLVLLQALHGAASAASCSTKGVVQSATMQETLLLSLVQLPAASPQQHEVGGDIKEPAEQTSTALQRLLDRLLAPSSPENTQLTERHPELLARVQRVFRGVYPNRDDPVEAAGDGGGECVVSTVAKAGASDEARLLRCGDVSIIARGIDACRSQAALDDALDSLQALLAVCPADVHGGLFLDLERRAGPPQQQTAGLSPLFRFLRVPSASPADGSCVQRVCEHLTLLLQAGVIPIRVVADEVVPVLERDFFPTLFPADGAYPLQYPSMTVSALALYETALLSLANSGQRATAAALLARTNFLDTATRHFIRPLIAAALATPPAGASLKPVAEVTACEGPLVGAALPHLRLALAALSLLRTAVGSVLLPEEAPGALEGARNAVHTLTVLAEVLRGRRGFAAADAPFALPKATPRREAAGARFSSAAPPADPDALAAAACGLRLPLAAFAPAAHDRDALLWNCDAAAALLLKYLTCVPGAVDLVSGGAPRVSALAGRLLHAFAGEPPASAPGASSLERAALFHAAAAPALRVGVVGLDDVLAIWPGCMHVAAARLLATQDEPSSSPGGGAARTQSLVAAAEFVVGALVQSALPADLPRQHHPRHGRGFRIAEDPPAGGTDAPPLQPAAVVLLETLAPSLFAVVPSRADCPAALAATLSVLCALYCAPPPASAPIQPTPAHAAICKALFSHCAGALAPPPPWRGAPAVSSADSGDALRNVTAASILSRHRSELECIKFTWELLHVSIRRDPALAAGLFNPMTQLGPFLIDSLRPVAGCRETFDLLAHRPAFAEFATPRMPCEDARTSPPYGTSPERGAGSPAAGNAGSDCPEVGSGNPGEVAVLRLHRDASEITRCVDLRHEVASAACSFVCTVCADPLLYSRAVAVKQDAALVLEQAASILSDPARSPRNLVPICAFLCTALKTDPSLWCDASILAAITRALFPVLSRKDASSEQVKVFESLLSTCIALSVPAKQVLVASQWYADALVSLASTPRPDEGGHGTSLHNPQSSTIGLLMCNARLALRTADLVGNLFHDWPAAAAIATTPFAGRATQPGWIADTGSALAKVLLRYLQAVATSPHDRRTRQVAGYTTCGSATDTTSHAFQPPHRPPSRGQLAGGVGPAGRDPVNFAASSSSRQRSSLRTARGLLRTARNYLLATGAQAHKGLYKAIFAFFLAHSSVEGYAKGGAGGKGGFALFDEVLGCIAAGGKGEGVLDAVPPQMRDDFAKAAGDLLWHEAAMQEADVKARGLALPLVDAFAALSRLPPGQALLQTVRDFFPLLLGSPLHVSLFSVAPEAVLATLRNLSFSTPAKPSIARNPAVTGLLLEILGSTEASVGGVRLKWLASSCLWSLVYNAEKAKSILKKQFSVESLHHALAIAEHHFRIEQKEAARINAAGNPLLTEAAQPSEKLCKLLSGVIGNLENAIFLFSTSPSV
ncbi:hypothetical protein DIPPA_21127 [Diplonema papillatum]|nr:hypothetical protein DIPPA_21127 [Diplonema papillatum]